MKKVNVSNLKSKLANRELVFGAWMSFSHPSIAEIFSSGEFDFLAIDMEHTTINLEQAQRIIAASQSFGVPCLPRPVSHSNDWIKPLLDSGADGIIAPLVNSRELSINLRDLIKYPPMGKRSFGVNRAHGYGKDFDSYLQNWNDASVYIAQIENIEGLANIDQILETENLDGVMIGPYDMSGSLGVPGQTQHPLVLEAEKTIIDACLRSNKSCGTQLAQFTSSNVQMAIDKGYNFIFASSDLFILNDWTHDAGKIIRQVTTK
jgi:2-keto-3-deoxy-L-rhamnonate aldolase RhmA